MSVVMVMWNIIVILVQNVGPLFFAAGLILAFIYWVTFMFIIPAIAIRKEMKKGKTLRQAWGEVFNGGSSFNSSATYQHLSSGAPHKYDALSDTVGNPAYSSIPGNISYRR